MKLLFLESYLACIKNSVKSHAFRNFYAEINGQTKDILNGGVTSCAFFVSSILLTFGLIKANHLTVEGLLKDLKKSGWYEISQPLPGSVLLWEEKRGHKHLGFLITPGKAVSNSATTHCPEIHSWNYNGNRKVIAAYWHKRLENNTFN